MVRSLIHKSLRALGFDIVSVQNLNQELANRELARQNAALEEFRRLSTLTKIAPATMHGEMVWVDRDHLVSEAVRRMLPADVVLDIGCAFRPQKYIEARTHICCEPFKEYMDRLLFETSGSTKYVYLDADFSSATKLFPNASVDSIFMVDVIEHIHRSVGKIGLDKLKRIARSQVIIFTPLGFMDQNPSEDGVDPWGMGGAKWQQHQSGWEPDDFPLSDGWTVIACKDFHLTDGYGNSLEKPAGAFWAIWNAPATQQAKV